MKIGILTQPFVTNYGGILQNYALQTVLKQRGYDVVTLDFKSFDYIIWIKQLVRYIIHFDFQRPIPLGPLRSKIKYGKTRTFINTYISITNEKYTTPNDYFIKKNKLDAIIVGSDQVWRPKYNCYIEDMFLSFANNYNIKKLSYAASFGVDNWEFSDLQTRLCSQLVKQFAGISVREQSAIGLCRKYLGVDATFVLDPTLLLDRDHYISLCKDVPSQQTDIFAYFLDQNNDNIKLLSTIAKSNSFTYRIKGIGENKDKKETIEQWISCFRDAKLILTDSFHGTVFSIIFNRDFYVIGNRERGNARFESLLSTFDLEDRLITSTNIVLKPIDWKKVNKIIEEQKSNSFKFLFNCLEK